MGVSPEGYLHRRRTFHRMKRTALLLAIVAMLASSCANSADDTLLVGIRASQDPAVGDSRFLFAVNEIDGTRRGSPEEQVSVTATSLESPDTVIEADAEFLWIIEGAIGLYRAEVPFDRSGNWEIAFDVSTGEETQPFLITVAERPTTVAIGEAAPVVATPTVGDTPIENLTTDSPPEPAFYQISLDEALTNGSKTVVVFSTPAYCTSAACGPIMQKAKELRSAYPEVNWVHVEVYEGFNEEGFAPDADHLAPAVLAFRLPSEPWVFVMDERGVVTARLEGVIAPGELEAHLDA
jgi:hypothetical protein